MTLLHRLASVARWLLRRNKAEQQLDDELRTFIEMSAAAKMREGAGPEEARRLAALELGGVDQIKERVRFDRHGAVLDEVGRNLRYSWRMFARQPGFVLIVVVTLALGIGANTAIFTLIDALMLRWLPVENPSELVLVQTRGADDKEANDAFSYPVVRALSDHPEIFSGVAGFSAYPFGAGLPGSVRKISGAVVSGGYYTTFGIKAAAGRLLVKSDDDAGAPLVAVISDGYWEREFGRQTEIVGQTIPVNGVPVTIVGVSPPGFEGVQAGSTTDVTIPLAALPQLSPQGAGLLGSGNFWLRILARPKSGISIPEAEARLTALWPEIADQLLPSRWPAATRKAIAQSVFLLSPGSTGWTYLRVMYRKPLLVLMAMVVLVLLIACANVACLLLARASARQREMAVRLAIGAGKSRILGQFLTESTLMSLMGGALGIALSWLSGRLLVNVISSGPVPVGFDLTPNWHILGFTLAIALATGILFGLAPAVQIASAGPSPALKDDVRVGSSRKGLLPWLVSAQVALALMLVIGASLFVRTLRNLQNLDPGFNRQGVFLVDFEGRRTPVSRALIETVQQIPGVVSTSLSTHTPLSGALWTDIALPHGQPFPERDNAIFVGAGPDFFQTLQVRLISGRGFSEQDTAGSAGVAVIDEAHAQKYFPGQNPLGKHLSAKVRGQARDLEIVGLAKNTKAASLRRPPYPTVYVSYAQLTDNFPTTMEIRVAGALADTAKRIQKVLQSAVPESPMEVRSLSAQVDAVMVQERMMATLAGAFGVLALALACVGLYGLLAYSVARRTREIGIRMALGAQQKRVIAMVLTSAGRLLLIGIALGLPAAWAASRWIESMLFRLKATDPATFGGAVLVLAAVALLAAYVPARRASRVDPLTVLRHE